MSSIDQLLVRVFESKVYRLLQLMGNMTSGKYCVQPSMCRVMCQEFELTAGSVKYLYPFQTAIPDFGAQRKRIETIRKSLGWRKIGCDLKECFE